VDRIKEIREEINTFETNGAFPPHGTALSSVTGMVEIVIPFANGRKKRLLSRGVFGYILHL